ncbi:MAG: hypothetical protein AAF577_00520 [Pseudomonadota bacterium]
MPLPSRRMPNRAPRVAFSTIALSALALAGCVAPQHAAEVHRFHATTAMALDEDRSSEARVAAGLSAAHTGITLGCTMLYDMPLGGLEFMREYCAAREQMIAQP